MANIRYFPRRGTTSEVGGIISTTSRKNTYKLVRMDIESVTCNKDNTLGSESKCFSFAKATLQWSMSVQYQSPSYPIKSNIRNHHHPYHHPGHLTNVGLSVCPLPNHLLQHKPNILHTSSSSSKPPLPISLPLSSSPPPSPSYSPPSLSPFSPPLLPPFSVAKVTLELQMSVC